MESVDDGGSEEAIGALGETTGHDDPSVGGFEDFCGGKVGAAGFWCMGHSGWQSLANTEEVNFCRRRTGGIELVPGRG